MPVIFAGNPYLIHIRFIELLDTEHRRVSAQQWDGHPSIHVIRPPPQKKYDDFFGACHSSSRNAKLVARLRDDTHPCHQTPKTKIMIFCGGLVIHLDALKKLVARLRNGGRFSTGYSWR